MVAKLAPRKGSEAWLEVWDAPKPQTLNPAWRFGMQLSVVVRFQPISWD